MRRSSGLLQLTGEMVSIVLLALTGRFIAFAQTTLESTAPLTIGRVLSYVLDILSVFTRVEHVALLAMVLAGASLIRLGLAFADRSMLVALKERAGIDKQDLSWGQRTIRLPIAVVYRSLGGISTLVGAIALALCFSMFNPEKPLGFVEAGAYMNSIASGITSGTLGALLLLFALYGIAVAVIGYVASPAVLSVEELASGCRPGLVRQPQPRAAP